MLKKIVVWESKEAFGTEYMELTFSDNQVKVDSTVILVENYSPYQVDYHVLLNKNWVVQQLDIGIRSIKSKSLRLFSNGQGKWFDKKGLEIDDLHGAIDIDLSCTPFTNSLPINRKTWNLHQPYHFEMVFISVPDLSIKKVHQRYEYIQGIGENRKFYYRSGSYETVLEVDPHGLVVDYPGIFTRIY